MCNTNGVDYEIYAQYTTVIGEMGAIMYAIKACQKALHAMGCPRVASNVRFETGAEHYRLIPLALAKED
ncbi:hypothetical protein BG015_001046 [Linnemannia schmuckeri]|uniref:Thiamine-binding protein domain-containing protein n=1 Tax=Linnemannia schmuckeri TaxID=64567 RepID=A0A9P5V766_9FUNG|nr:hypothetical protein BG015_001046 [Linnemannia schmuckeri]